MTTKLYRDEHKEQIKLYNKKYKLEHTEEIKEYNYNNFENKKAYNVKYRVKHKQKIKERGRLYQQNNKEKINEKSRRYYLRNKEKIIAQKKKYQANNKEKVIESRRLHKEQKHEYIKNKRLIDPLYKLSGNLRTRIGIAFREILNIKKNKHTFEMIGCSPQELKVYIENKFTIGMTWENQGKKKDINDVWIYGWDIDHIIPCASAKTEEELIKLCHYTNLQPLWHIDNIIKNKY